MVCGISILAKLGKGIFFVVVRLREQVPSSNSRLSSEIGHGQMPIAVLCSGLLWAAQGEGAVQELGAVLELGLRLGLLSLWLCSSGSGSAEEISSSFGLDECIEIVCGFCAKVNRLIDKSLRQRCRRRRRCRSSIYAVKTAADCFDNASTATQACLCLGSCFTSWSGRHSPWLPFPTIFPLLSRNVFSHILVSVTDPFGPSIFVHSKCPALLPSLSFHLQFKENRRIPWKYSKATAKAPTTEMKGICYHVTNRSCVSEIF